MNDNCIFLIAILNEKEYKKMLQCCFIAKLLLNL